MRVPDDLTALQNKALEFIRSSIERRGGAPTLRELCDHMGYSAIGSAQDVVGALRKKGYLAAPAKQAARAFALTLKAKKIMTAGRAKIATVAQDFEAGAFFNIPCLGAVPAGNPLEAIEERIDTLRMSTTMFARPRPKEDQLFAVRAVGLSMIQAGICSGDWLVVRAQKEAEPGSIVVARVDGDVTCKRLMKDARRGWFLKPENADFKPIYAADESFEIVGKVLALQRAM